MLCTDQGLYEDVKSFARKWWIFLLLGILFIGVGGYMVYDQEHLMAAYDVLSIIFAAFFLTYGIVRFAFVIVYRKSIPAWGWSLVPAILILMAGISLCFTPYMSEMVMLLVYALSFIICGINTIFNVALLDGPGWKLLTVLLGVLTICAGCFMVRNPFIGVLTIVLMAAIGLFSSGIACIAAAYKLSVIKSELNKVTV